MQRRLVRLQNHMPVILGALAIAAAGVVMVDRLVSLAAKFARAAL
jgi:hypothetical protein